MLVLIISEWQSIYIRWGDRVLEVASTASSGQKQFSIFFRSYFESSICLEKEKKKNCSYMSRSFCGWELVWGRWCFAGSTNTCRAWVLPPSLRCIVRFLCRERHSWIISLWPRLLQQTRQISPTKCRMYLSELVYLVLIIFRYNLRFVALVRIYILFFICCSFFLFFLKDFHMNFFLQAMNCDAYGPKTAQQHQSSVEPISGVSPSESTPKDKAGKT